MTQINLRALPSLREYPNDELKLLATAAPAREYEAGAQLCKEGDPARSCYLLATGSVEIRKHTPDGERVLATLKAGAIVGQMALVDRSPRSATVQAAEPTIALELTRDVFEDLLRSSSPLALRFQEHIAVAGIRQLRLATQRLASLASSKQGHPGACGPELRPAAASEREHGGAGVHGLPALRRVEAQSPVAIPAAPAMAHVKMYAGSAQSMQPGAQ